MPPCHFRASPLASPWTQDKFRDLLKRAQAHLAESNAEMAKVKAEAEAQQGEANARDQELVALRKALIEKEAETVRTSLLTSPLLTPLSSRGLMR